MGSVNTWLLRGDPLTLIDTGPRDDEALTALEAGLRDAGVRVEDIELVLVTHHHLDHSGLATTIAARSGARDRARSTARPPTARDYAERDRCRPALLARADAPPRRPRRRDRRQRGLLGLHPRARPTPTTPTSCCPTARRSAPAAATCASSRGPATAPRTRCSSTSASGLAFVGDHLLAGISSNTEVYPAVEPDGTRPRARVEYLREPAADRRHAARPAADRPRRRRHRPRRASSARALRRPPTAAATASSRCSRSGRASAYEIATHLWSPRTVAEQPLLVVWEVLGHLDLLLDAGRVERARDRDGSTYGVASFALARRPPEPTTP